MDALLALGIFAPLATIAVVIAWIATPFVLLSCLGVLKSLRDHIKRTNELLEWQGGAKGQADSPPPSATPEPQRRPPHDWTKKKD